MFRRPFIDCPFCNKKTFGVCVVSGNRYFRRCNSCYRPTGFEKKRCEYTLPPIYKKIIYIDQFALSEMMKSINKSDMGKKKAPGREFYFGLFGVLSRLTTAQLILCPSSDAHTHESVISQRFQDIKRMYDQLSYGISFYNFNDIERKQTIKLLGSWYANKNKVKWNFDPQRIVYSPINVWQDSIFITTPQHYMLDFESSILQERESISDGLKNVCKRWRNEKNRDFDDWFKEEGMAFGESVLKIYSKLELKRMMIAAGKEPYSLEDIWGPPKADFVADVLSFFSEKGLGKNEANLKTVEFFSSDILLKLPFLEIGSLMWASVARKIASGQKRLPNGGMSQDIETISNLLPYCDAMFVDRECHAFLTEQPTKSRLEKYKTMIFSASNSQSFMDYLDNIENEGSEVHMKAVEELYGDNWAEPYITMYDR